MRGVKGSKKAYDRWEKLPPEFREEADRSTEAELRSTASKISFNQDALMTAKKQDMDLASKATAHAEAGRVYREGTALNKLKIAYLRAHLDSKGCSVPQADDFLKKDTEDASA